MKAKLYLIAILAMVAFSCSDDEKKAYSCSSCVDSPEALVANNGTGKGIYKGVVVGSSGTLKIDMDNAGEGHITATLVVDGHSYALTTSGTYNVEGGFDADFINANAGISISFYVNTAGSFELYDIVIPDHDGAAIQLIKEKSTDLVMAFEGTYSGDAAGTFTLVARTNMDSGEGFWVSVSKEGEDEAHFEEGSLDPDGTVTGGGDVEIVGAIKGDIISGTWATLEPQAGTWRGKRTL